MVTSTLDRKPETRLSVAFAFPVLAPRTDLRVRLAVYSYRPAKIPALCLRPSVLLPIWVSASTDRKHRSRTGRPPQRSTRQESIPQFFLCIPGLGQTHVAIQKLQTQGPQPGSRNSPTGRPGSLDILRKEADSSGIRRRTARIRSKRANCAFAVPSVHLNSRTLPPTLKVPVTASFLLLLY